MNPMFPNFWLEAVGWTLIHSLWQSAAIAAIAAAALRFSRSSQLNYLSYCIALAAALICSAVTFSSKLQRADRPAGLVEGDLLRAPVNGAPSRPDAAPAPAAGSDNSKLNRLMPTIVTAWGLGVLLMTMRLMVAGRWIHRLRKTSLPWENDEWQGKFRVWNDNLGIRRAVKLCTTAMSEVPAVIGHLKPIVLLPAAILTQLTPQQLEAVILHELMHIRRNDYLMNLVQIGCETVFFFNPAIWWLSRSIRTEREHCCDELVAGRAGDKVSYAKALVRLEELRLAPGAALAVAANDCSLKNRISRLLASEHPRCSLPVWSGAVWAVLLIIVAFTFAWPRAVAQEEQPVSFEMRSVVEQGTPGSEILPFKRKEGGPQQLAVAGKVLLDNTHFAALEVTEDPLAATGIAVPKQNRAVVRAVRGTANYSTDAGANWRKLSVGDNLNQDALIRTNPRSTVDLSLGANGPVVRVTEDTTLGIDKLMTNASGNGKPQITVSLTPAGSVLFAQITRDHVRRQIAIVLDKAIISAPVVNEPITGGTFIISGDFTREEAAELVKKLQPKANKGAMRAPEQIKAPPWSPPPGMLPSTALAEAQAETAAGRYEEALARHLWYHTASRTEPGQGGVRHSFALGYWLKLGQLYPPALAKLEQVRDDTGNALRRDKTADYFTLFHEYSSINATLREDGKTLELFLWLEANDPEVAKRIYPVAQPTLIRAREYKLCAKYLKPDQFNRMLANYERHKKMAGQSPASGILEFGENKFRNETATLVAVLVLNDDKTSAERIASQAVAAWDDPTLKKMIDAARGGEVPEPWP